MSTRDHDDGDDLLRDLRSDGEELPKAAASESFWTTLASDVDAAVTRAAAAMQQRRRRNTRRWTAGFSAAAALVALATIALYRVPHVTPPAPTASFQGFDGDENDGVLVEELSDEELARVLRDFQQGG